MENDRLIYLSILLVVIGGSYLIANRNNFGQLAKSAGVWVLIFTAITAGIGMWQDIQNSGPSTLQEVDDNDRIVLTRKRGGHFHATLKINETDINFLVDTGATNIVLTQQDAEKIGHDLSKLEYWGRSQTANGTVPTAPIRLDRVTLGPYTDKNVLAHVNGGELFQSLLGMSYLDNYSRIEFAGDKLYLTR